MNQRRFEIARRIKIINNIFAGNRNRSLDEFHLTFTQMDIMLYLMRNSERVVYQKEIEEVSRMANPTVTGILNRLAEKGMITRRVDERDRRYRAVQITSRGNEVLRNMGDRIHQTEEILFGCLTEEEEEQLLRLLDKVAEHGGCGV